VGSNQADIQAELDRAAAAGHAGDLAAAAETSTASATEDSAAEGSAAEAEHVDSGTASVTSTVIRGDHPAAAGLANVWLELRKTLAFLADTAPPGPGTGRGRTVRATSTFRSARTSKAVLTDTPAEETAPEPGEGEETA
jgi:hypothetical protein